MAEGQHWSGVCLLSSCSCFCSWVEDPPAATSPLSCCLASCQEPVQEQQTDGGQEGHLLVLLITSSHADISC